MGQLTVEQRYQIQVLKTQNFSQTYIAKEIGKHKSVVCRELKRNSDGRSREYKAELAQRKCNQRHKNKVKRNDFSIEIEAYVENLIAEDYSPEQIVGKAKKDKKRCVSIERIYQHIWSDKKEGGVLYKHLRNKGKRYRKRGSKKDSRGIIQGRVSIDERPKIVDKKLRIGDLEMDLVIGKNHKKAILTINDRATGKVKISLLNSKSADEIREKTLLVLKEWKPWLKTITTDNGKEFAQHQDIAKSLEIDYFFAHPYHSWERGANENFNGLLRQYFPKKYDFNLITKEDLQAVEDKLNNRPRKRCGFLTPNQVYLQALNNNGQVAFKT